MLFHKYLAEKTWAKNMLISVFQNPLHLNVESLQVWSLSILPDANMGISKKHKAAIFLQMFRTTPSY